MPELAHSSDREVGRVVGWVLAAKLAWLLVDPQLRVFLGDSASYLHAALTVVPPPDRSFTYAWLLRASALATGSGLTVLLVQAAIGLWSAVLVYALLRRHVAVRPGPAGAIAVLVALEPSQILYERMLMAETSALAAMLASLACVLEWTRDRRWHWIVGGALFGALAASLRTAWLPVALGLVAIAPLIVVLVRAPHEGVAPLRAAALGLLAGLATMLAALAAHGGWIERGLASEAARHGRMIPASELHAGDRMLLSLMLPLARPEHFAGLGLPEDFLARLAWPTDDLRYRELHTWAEGGVFAALERATPTPMRAARVIALRAFRDDRIGFIALGFRTWARLADPVELRYRILDDLGARAPTPEQRDWFVDRLRVDVGGVAPTGTPAGAAYAVTAPLLVAWLVLLPVAALALAARAWRARDAAGLTLAAAALGTVASIVLFSPVATPRYLHALPALLALVGTAVATGTAAHRSRSSAGAPR